MILNSSVYIGTIIKSIPPKDKKNATKYEYNYLVQLTIEKMGQSTFPCVKIDDFGAFQNFNDEILSEGSAVIVVFPRNDSRFGIIIGGLRQYKGGSSTSFDSGKFFWKKRYNKFELSIDDNFNYKAESDSGPFLSVKTNQVILDDSVGENLTLDKDKKTTTINTKDLVTNVKNDSKTTIDKNAIIEVKENVTIKIKGNVTLTVDGDVTIKCKNLKAEVKESAEIKSKQLKAKVSGDAEVNASKSVKIKSPSIELNGGGSGVTTAAGHYNVVDFITGIPCIPSSTITGDV
jgi:type VI secretion system secreted protein VgrG